MPTPESAAQHIHTHPAWEWPPPGEKHVLVQGEGLGEQAPPSVTQEKRGLLGWVQQKREVE